MRLMFAVHNEIMKTDEYMTFLTVKLVKLMEEPHALRRERRQLHKLQREPFLKRWFGLLPMSIMLFILSIRSK